MDVYAVICEYNPFHAGHAYLLEKCRENGADAVVCVMSGSFVQRGEAAVMSKFARAQAAVFGGADLVVELPHAFAMASAPRFAQAGVKIASLAGAGHLAFGAECGNAQALLQAARLCQSAESQALIRENLSKGMDYPAAQTAAAASLDAEAAKLMRSPNNALAIEYLRAMEAYPDMKPFAVARTGAGHDADFDESTASASFIRKLLLAGGDGKLFMPAKSAEIFANEKAAGRAPVRQDSFDGAVMTALKKMSVSDFSLLPDVSEGLENRLFRAAHTENSLEAFCAAVKTKRYTHARIRRIAMAAFTGLTSEYQGELPSYIRVLALNKKGRALLTEIPESIPVITKPASASLEGADARLFALEAQADELWSLGLPEKKGFSAMRQSPVYIDL